MLHLRLSLSEVPRDGGWQAAPLWLSMKGASEVLQSDLLESGASPPDGGHHVTPRLAAPTPLALSEAGTVPCSGLSPPGVTLAGSLLFVFLLCGWQLRL